MAKSAKQQGQRVGYIRVSTHDQNTVRQLDGIKLDRMFTDKASGKDVNRPQLHAALAHVREGDTLIVHSSDRIARNLRDLLHIVEDLTGRGVTMRFEKEQLTFTGDDSPMAKLQLQMLGAFSEFERSLILERQREGIAIAKKAGKYAGRKRALTPERIAALRKAAKKKGVNKAHLAREFGISRETLYQYTRTRKAA